MILSHVETIFSGTVTESGNTSATPIKTEYDKEAIIYLDITAVSGTNPTLDLTFKTYDPLSQKWYELASFNQKTATGQDVGYIEYGINERLAVFYVVGGTDTPTFTFSISVNLKNA
jgi:hypothetical protein